MGTVGKLAAPGKGHGTYTAYGFGARAESALGYAGEWHDATSQGYLLGNGQRLYHPALMRFSSSDSISPFGKGGLNAYAYCQGDPVNYVDRSGHDVIRTFQQVFSGFTGLINTALSGFKVSTSIIKRSIHAAHQGMTAEQYLNFPGRQPEYPLMARAGNSIATVSGVTGLILGTPPGVIAAWVAPSSAASIASSGIRLGTGGTGMVGRGMIAWDATTRTIADINQYNIGLPALGVEVAKEMFGVNLLRGRESGIVRIELPEEMGNVRTGEMPATTELLELRLTNV